MSAMRQKGQGLVEFALIVPWLFLLFLGIMYGGMMFSDYLQFSNAARQAARDISIQLKEEREEIVENINAENGKQFFIERYAKSPPMFYVPDVKASFSSDGSSTTQSGDDPPAMRSVEVRIELERPDTVPGLFPKEFPPSLSIRYVMPLEEEAETESSE